MKKLIVVLLLFCLLVPVFAADILDFIRVSKDGSLETYGRGQLSGAVEIPSVVNGIPVKEIDDEAFYNWDDVTSFVIPDTVEEIEEEAFRGCSSLKSVKLGKKVSKIDDKAFKNCNSLKEVTLHSSVKSIGHSVFESCESLTDIYYNGTMAKWNKIKIKNDCFDDINNHVTVHCTDGDIIIEVN